MKTKKVLFGIAMSALVLSPVMAKANSIVACGKPVYQSAFTQEAYAWTQSQSGTSCTAQLCRQDDYGIKQLAFDIGNNGWAQTEQVSIPRVEHGGNVVSFISFHRAGTDTQTH